jgi:hypothetical protein
MRKSGRDMKEFDRNMKEKEEREFALEKYMTFCSEDPSRQKEFAIS